MIRLSTILSLLVYGVAASGLLPLAPYLERLPLAVAGGAFCWGVYADRREAWLNGKVATILAVAASAWYLLQVNQQNVAAPMVSIVVLLLAVRFITAKSHRNYLQIMTLSLFCLAASSLYGLSPYFLALLLAQLLLVTVALVFLTFYQQDHRFTIKRSDFGPLLKTALAIPLATVPLMIFFFFILPRTQFPLWNLLARGGSERSGVSDTLQPGDKSSISTGGGVVFRAAMKKIPSGNLYWRCMVLNSFDGRSWKRIPPPATDTPLHQGTELTEQTIFLEPGQTPFYPGLDIPVQLGTIRGSRTVDNLFQPGYRGGTRLKYRMQSALEPGPFRRLMKIDREFYTALPENIPVKLGQIGRQVGKRYHSDREKVAGIEDLFISYRLNYSTTGLPTGAGAMEDFLFVTRKGHCELFASTFALLLRSAGVPARLVGGFLGGEYSDVGGYYLVNAAKAHIWVEAWLEGSGWVRTDPSRLTETFGEVTDRSNRSLSSRLAVYLDALNYYWNSAVINYDMERQISLVTSAGSSLQRFSLPKLSGGTLLRFAMATLLLVGIILLARRKPLSTEEKILRRFLRLLQRRYGVDIPPGKGLRSIVAPLHEPELDRFVEIYSAVIYRDCTLSDGELRELKGVLRELEKKR